MSGLSGHQLFTLIEEFSKGVSNATAKREFDLVQDVGMISVFKVVLFGEIDLGQIKAAQNASYDDDSNLKPKTKMNRPYEFLEGP